MRFSTETRRFGVGPVPENHPARQQTARVATIIGALSALFLLTTAPLASASLRLTDSAVFSSNADGENWNGWVWNTQGLPEDTANRWNLYYSSSSDPQNPLFLNSGNAADAGIDIEMSVGTHTFTVFGESLNVALDPLQHFVLNLYFDDNQGPADISGLNGQSCPDVCPTSNSNGLDLFGNSGLGGNLNAQTAGTLFFAGGGRVVELTRFTWAVDGNVDQVWAHHDNTAPYDSGSGTPDFVGQVELTVRSLNNAEVPEPTMLGLLGLALAGLGLGTWRRRQRRFTDTAHKRLL